MTSESILSGIGQFTEAFSNSNPFLAFVRNFTFRKKYRSYLLNISKKEGNCFCCQVPRFLISDKTGRSKLVVFENGAPLSQPHSLHSEIERLGAGRYSHWENWILFSTSDNSSPLDNGRIYSVREMNY